MTEPRVMPARLWHYTTSNGLLEILRTKSLWSTHIGYLNDATEFQHGIDVLDGAAKARHSEQELARVGWPQVLETTSTRLWDEDERELTSTYVTSFCAAEDLLSMWRSYPGAGVGYALCFDPKTFPASSTAWPGRLHRCLYDEAEKVAKLPAAMHRLERLVGLPGTPTKEQRDRTAWEISLDLQSVSPQFKHGHFYEEQEWRLVCHARSDGRFSGVPVRYRSGLSTLIPHLALPLELCGPALGLQAIMVGPGPHQKASATALRMLLKTHAMSDVSVELSRAPLRTV